jgi:predicted MFS family arabinose efflux permease
VFQVTSQPIETELGAPSGAPTPKSHRYTVWVLCGVYALSCLDRNVINILAEPIKRELALADWQLGVLTGVAFALFYTLLGLPLARFADRPSVNRVRLISICVGIWSLATAACGLAGGFVQLMLARFAVGVGEAGAGPSAHALIGDLVPPKARASAMGVYALGIPLGSLLGLSIGGFIAQNFSWRVAFMVVGLPGLLMMLLVWLTLREAPSRATPNEDAESFGTAAVRLGGSRVFVSITLAAALMTVLAAGQGAFLGSLLIRVHHLNVGQAGPLLGLAIGGGGFIGSLVGGRVVDRFAANDVRRHMLFPIGAGVLGAAVFLAAILSPTAILAVPLLGLAAVLNQSWYGPAFSAIQRVTPSRRRATAAAIHAFGVNLLGVSLGPLIIGILSDTLNKGFTTGSLKVAGLGPQEGLRYALVVLAVMPLLAGVAFYSASTRIREEIEANEG